MNKPTYKFAVTAPRDWLGPDAGRTIVSRHVTRAAAERAAKNKPGFKVIEPDLKAPALDAAQIAELVKMAKGA